MNRRTFVKASAGAAGVATVAGCLGEDDVAEVVGEDGDLVMQTSTQDTTAFAMSQGISEVIRQNTEDVSIEPRESEGTNANVGDLADDSAQIVYLQNWTANLIDEGEDPFDDLGYEPYQVMHYYDLGWFLATANDDWTSVTDIESDSRVSPTPRGSGSAEMIEHALGYAVDDYDRVSVGFGEQGSEMNDGSLDVGAGTLMNFEIEPGWLDEMKLTTDLRVLDWPGDAVDDLRDDPGVSVTDVDMTEFEDYDHVPDTLPALTLSYNFVVRDNMAYDPIYTYLETLWNNREELADQHPVLGYLQEDEFWVQNMYDLPFHPAAADFYEERGIWREEFERGEEV